MLLLEGKKLSSKEVSSIVGVSVSTVYTLISKLTHNCSYNRKIGSGRPPKALPLIANTLHSILEGNLGFPSALLLRSVQLKPRKIL